MTKEQKARSLSGHAIRRKRLIPSAHCSKCGKVRKTEGHHDDYDKPLEVVWLCRSCHMIEDGRMDIIHIKKKQPPKKCKICGRLKKPMRKGRCHACNEYLVRHGIERPFISDDGRREKTEALKNLPCIRCGRPAGIVGKPIKGYCTSCYTYVWRQKKSQRCHLRLDIGKHMRNRSKKTAPLFESEASK